MKREAGIIPRKNQCLAELWKKIIKFLNGAAWRNPKRNSIRAFWNTSRKR
ncbi:suppression of tumorigenicity 18 protein isoform h [Homo sapiens]|nr:suppression of tumorigenicity 18 protein isoform h [Homo sapiens]NP_001339813.1 suppression of tumorigenicity 18 protein isoform h [Homo sapiens]|eukprot:NP_001339812.1 suppression of tumorigenicity 18 protein isoform h [Homo sapiens]